MVDKAQHQVFLFTTKQKNKEKNFNPCYDHCILTLHSGFSWSLYFSSIPSTSDLPRVTLKLKSPNQNTLSKLAVKSSSTTQKNKSRSPWKLKLFIHSSKLKQNVTRKTKCQILISNIKINVKWSEKWIIAMNSDHWFSRADSQATVTKTCKLSCSQSHGPKLYPHPLQDMRSKS